MTFQTQSIEFFDLNSFFDGALSAADLASTSALFQDYKNLGVNTVTIGWGVPVNEATGSLASSFNVAGVHAASLSEIQAIANVAEQLGLSVILKPQAQTMDVSGTNGALPDNVYSSDVGAGFNANTFLSQWATYMGSVGSLAQQVHASMVVEGTENAGFDTTAYLSQWTNIINQTRATYSGPLTYASFGDPMAVPFWGELNVIGIDAYYGLTTSSNPSYSDVLAGWTNNTVPTTLGTLGASSGPINIVAELQALSAEYGKPLYFSEFGGQAFDGVVNNPAGAGPSNKVADWQQQEWLYQSMFQAISQDNSSGWFQGVNLWAAFTGDTTEESARFASYLADYPANFDIRGKPAGLATAAWFGASDYLTSTQSSFTGSLADDRIVLYGQVANSANLLQSFNTTVSITLDGTIIGGQAPTVHFYINGIDEGAQQLSTTPGTYTDPQGVAWSADQTFTFTLPGLVNVSQIKMAIDSPVNVGGVENSQTFVAAAAVNGVALTNETYTPLVGSPETTPFNQGGQYDGGSVLLDASPWNTQLAADNIGTAVNPIQVNGGGGTDTAFVLGPVSDYTITTSSGVIDLRESAGLNQNANLTGIAQVQFSDYTLVFDLASSQDLLVYQLYQAAFDRVPDNAGFRFWATYADATSASAVTLADYFLAAPEFTQKYGSNPTNLQYVTELYSNVLGRAPDQAGLTFWVNVANTGYARDLLLVDFATSTENVQLIAPHTSNGLWTTH